MVFRLCSGQLSELSNKFVVRGNKTAVLSTLKDSISLEGRVD